MKSVHPLMLLAAPLLVLGACSLLLSFDPNGQPCDADHRCLTNYQCLNNVCVAVDGGTAGCNPACATGNRCLESTNTCVQDTCANRQCPVGSACASNGSGTTCVPVTAPNLGQPCTADTDCNVGVGARFCFIASVLSGGGSSRTGFCAERCTASSGCMTSGATCAPYLLGLDAGRADLCLPEKLVTPCTDDSTCRSEGFVCTVYGNATLGAISLCDAPYTPGARTGQSCGPASADGGTPCANGLCISTAAIACRVLCDGSCDAGSTCSLVDFAAPGGTRKIPACIPGP